MFHKKIFQSQYVKNFTALAGSEVIAQLILIGVMPLLTRIYTPKEFGQYELFKAASLFLVIVGFWNYDASVYSSRNNKERINSLALSTIILTGNCLLTAALLFYFNDLFVKLIGSEVSEGWFWTLPLYAFFSALTNLALVSLSKSGNFKLLSGIKIVVSVLVASTQLFFGWIDMGYWGLVYSTIVVQCIAFAMYSVPFYLEFKNNLELCSKREMTKILHNYWRLPLFVLPGSLLNNVVQNLPVFFLARIDSQALGYYGLARRIIEYPLSFVSVATQRLYIKDISDEIAERGNGIQTFLKNLRINGVITLVLVIGILIGLKPLLPLFFGNEWLPAAPFILVLGIYFSVRYLFGGLSFVLILGSAPKFALAWQISFGLLVLLIFQLCFLYNLSVLNTIRVYSYVGIFSYFIYGVLSYQVAKRNEILSHKEKA